MVSQLRLASTNTQVSIISLKMALVGKEVLVRGSGGTVFHPLRGIRAMAEDIRPGHIARQREAVPILVQPFAENCVVD